MQEENSQPELQEDSLGNQNTETPLYESETEHTQPIDDDAMKSAKETIKSSLLHQSLGVINFDTPSSDNTSSHAMVPPEKRDIFKRDIYVLISDKEQNIEFLGRIVEGPFHTPHEIGTDSALTRTTILHPDRTKFRPTYYATGTIEVLGELVEGERVIPTPTRPRPYADISIFPADRLSKLLGIDGNFYLGHLMGYDGVDVYANADSKNFLPRNVGIFGTVGSGKSNTTQVLIEESIENDWAVVVIDVEGEYVKMNEPTDNEGMVAILTKYGLDPKGIEDFHVYVPTSGDSDADNPIEFKVPISGVDFDILADVLELTEPQTRLLFKAQEFASRHKSKQTSGGVGLGAAIHGTSSQNGNPYTLQTLINAFTEKGFTDDIQSHEQSTAHVLRSKLIKLGMSHILDWNKTNNVDELDSLALLKPGRLSVIDVSETDDRSRNIAIAYILQSLFSKTIEHPLGTPMHNGENRPKILVVLEEVHSFVSRMTAHKMKAVLDNLQIISRRGRKRWMSLALVSQQPGHVPDELFELVNTRFIHQLKSATNLAPVKQTTGGVHEALWSTIPSLGPGQCLFTGSVIKNPIFVNFRPAKSKRQYSD